MKLFKQDKGHTLIELIIVIALVGIVFVGLFTVMLSVNRTYVRADKKAQNLEEARLIINQITDNFQSHDKCQVTIVGDKVVNGVNPATAAVDADFALEGGFAMVKKVEFTDVVSGDTITFTYDQPAGKLNWFKKTSVEMNTDVINFQVRPKDELLEFKIEVIKEGHGVVADQTLEVGTTLNLKYRPGD